ncbi:MAG: serine hydrolase domain-containing protein [Anaerolineae bacterium]
MTRVVRLLLVLFLFTVALPIAPSRAESTDTAAIDKIVREAMAMYNVPGVGLAIVKDGKPLYVQGYGVRSTATNDPVTADSQFALASVTKSFTALGVMELVKQGKLDLDKPIINYLPDFRLSDANATQTLTLRHVLSHSSGLPRADQWVFDDPKTREQIIAEMANIDLTAEPGKLWQYNNQNYVLAGYLIEKVTGKSWEQFITEHIFEPLGMKSVSFALDIEQANDWAQPHSFDILKGLTPMAYQNNLGAVGPAGSINASANEMATYALFQLSNGDDLLTPALMEEMHRGQIEMPVNATLYEHGMYAFGWYDITYRQHRMVEHDGGIFGYASKITLLPDDDLAIVLLSNSDGNGLLTEAIKLQLIDLLLGLEPLRDNVKYLNEIAGYDPEESKRIADTARSYKANLEDYEPLLGSYSGPLGVRVERRGAELWLIIAEQSVEMVLLPYADGKFVSNTPPIVGLQFTFNVAADGTVTLTQSVGGRDVEVARKLPQGSDSQTISYDDPQGKFTLTAPSDLVINTVQNFLLTQITDPVGTIILGSTALDEDALITVLKWVQQFDPTFQMEPQTTTTYTDADGDNWQQFEFGLPSNQTLVTRALVKGDTVIIVLFQMKTVDRDAVEKVANQLTDGVG